MTQETLPSLAELRAQIDAVDAQLVALFAQRARLAQQVGHVKKADAGGEIIYYRPERERQVLERVAALNPGPLANDEVKRLFRELMSACLALELPLEIAYLGPEGTFTQSAVFKQFGHSVRTQPKRSIADVFRTVETGVCHYGVVPVENSTEGVIAHTLDSFVQSPLSICGEVKVRVEQNLISTGSDLATITTVYSHSQSLAQCRGWLAENLPGAELISTASNAEAVKIVAGHPHWAAIGGKMAAELYGVPVRFANIEDESHNTTRFLIIGRQQTGPSGHDKTSLLVATANQAGALYQLLEPIQRFGFNMTKIESRPSKRTVWEYFFFIDIEGHQAEPRMQELFAAMNGSARLLRILGSYPIAGN